MDVRNCKTCGRLFNYLSGPPICERCKAALEDKFQIVKEYVREHQNVKMNEVAEECDVSIQQIQRWLREERLVLSEASGFVIECEKCGTPIRTGRFCQNCKNKIQGDLKSAYISPGKAEPEKTKEREHERMRFLDL